MQPTYLPWAGYFNLITSVDNFVFLDDAQFQKNSWHNRNQILINGDRHWITMPIIHDKLNQKICETSFKNLSFWQKKHSKMVRQNYSGHGYSEDVNEFIDYYEQIKADNLSDLNVKIILWLMHKIGIEKEIILSSDLGLTGERTDKILNILTSLGSTSYISPVGAQEYLIEDKFIEKSAVELKFQDFKPEYYPQKGVNDFISHLSIIDVIANTGWKKTYTYINR
jgi:hypothetical protein